MAPRGAALGALTPLALALALAPRRGGAQNSYTYPLTGSPTMGGVTFDGIGAAATGASARMIFEYDAATQSQLLDYLFAPAWAPSTTASYKGAALSILKLEIGGDANTGFGSEPSYAPLPGRTWASHGWSGRLAQAAVARNPAIKIMLSPLSWPSYLVAPGANDPYDNPAAAASYVATYVQLFQTTFSVTVSHVGVFGYVAGARFSPTEGPRQSAYITAMRNALNALGLSSVKIVCADQGGWSCATEIDPESSSYDRVLAETIDIVGNFNAPTGAQLTSAVKGIAPLWITDFARINARNDGAMMLSSAIFESFVKSDAAGLPLGSGVQGWVFGTAVSSTPYGFPGYHLGLLDASQPWSGHFSTTPALWAIAHFNQFIPATAGWKIAPTSTGNSGTLKDGGYYMTFYDPSSLDFVLMIQAFAGTNGGNDEIATFQLAGMFAELGITYVDVWYSAFDYYVWSVDHGNQTEMNHHLGNVPVENLAFQLRLNKTFLYTIWAPEARDASIMPVPHYGCDTRDCDARLPPPAAFGSRTLAFTDPAACSGGQPGTLLVSVDGTFECTTNEDPAIGSCLAMETTGVPLGPFESTLPHAMTGDENLADADVSVEVFVRQDSTALLGVRLSPLNTTVTPAPKAMNYARGLWLAVTPRAGGALDWKLASGLDAASMAAPAFSGTLANFAGAGGWFSLRLVARGARAIGSVGSSVLFNADVSASAPSAGFVGVATGEWAPNNAFFRNLAIKALATTCSAVPRLGAQIFMEMCELDAGTGFTFVPVDTDPTHDTYSIIYGYDAEDTESGTNMAYNGQACFGNATPACYMAACSLNSTQNASANPCAGFNANGWPKGGFNIVGPTELTNLYVKNSPAGLIQLSVDESLCVEAVDQPDGKAPNLLLMGCNATSAAQLWTVERSTGDTGWLTGPIRNARNGGVMDVNFLQDGLEAGSVDAPVNTYGFHGSSNQLFHFEGGMIRATQLGSLCIGACAYL